jgi:hypothetical protein
MKIIYTLLLGALCATAGWAADLDCRDCVGAKELAGHSVQRQHLAPKAVGTGKIGDGAVTAAKLADGAVGLDALDASLRSAVAGTTVPPTMKLVDARGALVGLVATVYLAEPGSSSSDRAFVWVDVDGEPVLLELRDDRLRGFEGEILYFATSDCSGEPLAPAPREGQLDELRAYGLSPTGDVYRARPDTVANHIAWSRLDLARDLCVTSPIRDRRVLTEAVGTLPAFEPPFRIVLE